MIQLDGNYGEGGGSLVRVALALSALTGKGFNVSNIRAGRKDSGLKAQHLHGINALKQICNAQTNEIKLGLEELDFAPGKIKKGTYDIDIGTAGSITLLLQGLILPCMFAPGKITLNIKGGTCGKWQASVDYLQNVLLPQLQRFVEKIELKVLRRGYFPKGGGEIRIEISPRFKLEGLTGYGIFSEELNAKTAKINLTTQGQLEQIRGIINISRELQEKEVGERIKASVENLLKRYNVPINIRVEYVQSHSVGGAVDLWAIFSQDGKVDFDNPVILGGDALVEQGKSSEEIGKEVAEKLAKEIDSESAVDHFLADQLISYMALLPNSEIEASEISNHTKTNIYVVENFLPVGYKIEGNRVRVEER
jgi:RNA 3'-phosphate cyclase